MPERGVKGRSDPINLFVMKRKKGYSQSLFTLLVCCVYIFFKIQLSGQFKKGCVYNVSHNNNEWNHSDKHSL